VRGVTKSLRRSGGAQGKRHQQNLAKRAAREAADKPAQPAPNRRASVRKVVNIGRPGYRVTKQYDPETDQRSLLFQARPWLTCFKPPPRGHRTAAGCIAVLGLCLAARCRLLQRTRNVGSSNGRCWGRPCCVALQGAGAVPSQARCRAPTGTTRSPVRLEPGTVHV